MIPFLPKCNHWCALWFILSIFFYRFEKWYSSWDISAQTCSPWPLFAGQLCQNHAPRMLETKFQFFNLVCFPRRRWYVRNGSEFPSLAWSSEYFWPFSTKFEYFGQFLTKFEFFGGICAILAIFWHFFVHFPRRRWFDRNGSEFPSMAWSSKYFWLFSENLSSFWFLFGCFGHFFVCFPGKSWYVRNGSEFHYFCDVINMNSIAQVHDYSCGV